jgi:hypothetical protein
MFILMVLYIIYLAFRALVLFYCKEEMTYKQDRLS